MFKQYLIFSSAIFALAAAATSTSSSTTTTSSSSASSSATSSSATATTTTSVATTTSSSSSATTTTTSSTHTFHHPAEPTPDHSDNRVYCSGTAHRKEVRHMKQDGDWDKFVSAFKSCGSDGTLDKHVNNYADNWSYFNSHPRFHPWHRILLKEFEKDLIAHGAPYLPYWDWSACYSQNPTDSPILNGDFCGAPSNDSSHTVYNGDFSADKYTCHADGKPLIRDYSEGKTSSFYHPALLNNILQQSSYSSYCSQVEYGPNAVVHEVLGGHDGQISDHRSPYDPLFWMHTAFLDKMWNTYQSRGHQDEYEGSAYGVSCSSSDTIAPWNIPVKNVLKCSDVCVSYVELPYNFYNACPTVTTVATPATPTKWYAAAGCNDTAVAAAVNSTVDNCASTVNAQIYAGTPAPTAVYTATNQQSTSNGFLIQPVITMALAVCGAALAFL